ncbi:MAG: DNA-processing protein DprA [Leifsonia sp.]
MISTLTNPVDRIRGLITDGLPVLSDEAIARVAWATISEPGDTVAAVLVAEHGPIHSLALLLAGDASTSVDRAALTGRATDRYSPGAVATNINRSIRLGAHILTPEHPSWPARLNDLGDTAPFALWCLGDPTVLPTADVCLTGARAATGYGETIAIELAAELTNAGRSVINGGAYGIDGASLRGALGTGGRPIAVLASGVDRQYPAGHTELLHTVAATGAVISQFVPGTAPTRSRFQERSRLLATLAARTVIVESGRRSGALAIATIAADLGRDVYAVPGPITSAASAGCHHLIREGIATLLTGIHDLTPTS